MSQAEQPFKREDLESLVLRLNSIPTPLTGGILGDGFIRDPMGSWRPISGDGLAAVEEECVQLHQDLATRIFGTIDYYYLLLPKIPAFLFEAGLNSESSISRDLFEILLQKAASIPELNRFLYLYDCRKLISAIQECTKELSQLVGEFYRILNCDPFFTPAAPQNDGVRWSTSPTVTNLTATLGFLFIRMHSLLDYSAKLAKEVQSLKSDFRSYPRLASSGFLFGQRSRLLLNKKTGTLFDDWDAINEIEIVRNLIIHDGLLDDMPKAYEVIEAGKAIERYVLMPDKKNGQFERYKNRHLFYGREDKINLRLATLVRNFQIREAETIKAIRTELFQQASDATKQGSDPPTTL